MTLPTITCKVCSAPADRTLTLGKLSVHVCQRHEQLVHDSGRALAGTAARVAGAYVQAKAPIAFETAKAVFSAIQQAYARNAAHPET